ncbi:MULTISPECIES: hypothetical protein [unclassified Calothrix]|uniref:hypothetical protein n=1 Tax=unclassified Calothrix TaxID=2619626 RepID=UPI001181A927|nr:MULTISPECIES: hypothetical protein [unclassified Calothrix]
MPPLPNGFSHYVAAILGGTDGRLSLSQMSADVPSYNDFTTVGIDHHHCRHDAGWNRYCFVRRLSLS